jgi:hypothetical protein
MVRKLPTVYAVAATLLFPVTTFAEDRYHGHDQLRDHDRGYHGQSWNYAVAPCWQRTPIGWI